MYTLYYSKGSCSLAPHALLQELDLPHKTVLVDLSGKSDKPADFLKRNPLGYVPVIITPDGKTVSENAVILQYLADQKPGAKLIPPQGSFERYQLQSTLNLVATEIHKTFSIVFNLKRMVAGEGPQLEIKKWAFDRLEKRLTAIEDRLSTQEYLMPEGFSVADIYLCTCLRWSAAVNFELSQFSALQKYFDKVLSRPSFQVAMRNEGILKAA